MAESMSIQAILSAVDSGFSSTMKSAEQAVSGLGSVSGQVTKQNKGFMSSIKSIAGGIGVYKLASAGLSAVSNSMGGAIDRFDTMNRFPKMMETMGYSAQDAQDSIDKLNQGVTGLPTALDTVVGTTQQLALMTGDLGQATDLTLALNNAFLSSGASTGDASRGLEQFTQMLSRGEVDLQSWRTLMETMPTALRQVADSFGLPADNAYALYDALKAGDITFDEFTNRMIELSETTGGFADQATEMTKGVRTAMENMKTAVVRGVEGMVSALDDGLQSLTGKGISDWINTFSKGISKGFKSAEKAMAGFFNFAKRLKPAFSEIGRQVTGFLEPLRDSAERFFKPVIDGFGEIGEAVTQFGYRMNGVLRAIGEGNWQSAWNIFRDSSLQAFERVGTAFSNMWTGMQKNIQAIDWRLTFQNISGSVQDVVSSINNWLTTAVPKVYDFIVDVLIDPNSQLNQGARDFHGQVMGLLDSAWDWVVDKVVNVLLNPEAEINDGVFHDAVMGEIDKAWAEIKSSVGEAYRELEVKIQLTWNELAGKVAEWVSGVKASILSGWAEIQGYSEALGAEGIQQEVVMDIMLREGEGWTGNEIKEWVDEKYGEGTYDAHVHLVPQLEAGEPEPSVQDAVESVLGNDTLTVEQEVEAKINIYAGQGFNPGRIQELIDKEFGAGTYESVVTAEILIEILEKLQYSEGRIQQLIDAEFGEGTYEALVNVQVETEEEVMKSHTLEPLIQGHIAGQVIEPIEKDVVVNPNIVIGHSASESMAGQVGVGANAEGGSGFDLSGITAQITAQLATLQTAVNTAMGNINSTIMTQASLWGTTIASAMTTMVTSVVATMTAMTLAVTLALTALTIAVTLAMTSLSETVTTTMTSMAETVAETMASMAETITQAMSEMVEAITEAMTALVEAVTAGMEEAVAVAEAGAEGIVDAVSGLYDSMYSAGESAGQGLADGLSSMEGAVRSAATALASAANVAAQLVFDINSPSKVWRGFGYSAGEGLVDGFDGSQRSVRKSATRLAVAGLPSIAPFSGRSSHVSVSGNVSTTQQNAELKSELSQIKKAIKEGQVIMLDGNTWVGATVDRMDTALGNNQSLGGRHQLS